MRDTALQGRAEFLAHPVCQLKTAAPDRYRCRCIRACWRADYWRCPYSMPSKVYVTVGGPSAHLSVLSLGSYCGMWRVCSWAPRGQGISIDSGGRRQRCKNVFTFFLFWSRFYVFNVFFQTFFSLKNVGKVQSGKQINKKHFQNNSNEIDLWFFSCMSNDLKCLPINF